MRALVTFFGSTLRRAICRSVLAALLFAQATGIAQACIEATQSPAMAFAETHEQGDCGKSINKNACLLQYTAGDQSSAQVEIAVAPMPVIAPLSVPVAPERVAYPAVIAASRAHCTGPPSSIRFCSFQL